MRIGSSHLCAEHYIVHHCKAVGQQPEAALTAEGQRQAERLAALPIERIIGSPFVRGRQSIAPLAKRLGLPVATDTRLAERLLAACDLPDWLAGLRSSFDDLDLRLARGEFSPVAMQRASQL
jgi:2,3-bisphosphoglycerate-dependent phosphoglycerate mutase